jgi:hypothetical protein
MRPVEKKVVNIFGARYEIAEKGEAVAMARIDVR